MTEQRFSQRRCRDARKPLAAQCPAVIFYRCPDCGAVFTMTGGNTEGEQEAGITCCSQNALRLTPSEGAVEAMKLEYQIAGGYNDNVVKVSWKASSPGLKPEWIYLKTFTGGYLKYIGEGKRPPLVFALADTDAFAYCDEDPCLECVFRCKRGFEIYAYSKEGGLACLPLDKMTAHWQSFDP